MAVIFSPVNSKQQYLQQSLQHAERLPTAQLSSLKIEIIVMTMMMIAVVKRWMINISLASILCLLVILTLFTLTHIWQWTVSCLQAVSPVQ